MNELDCVAAEMLNGARASSEPLIQASGGIEMGVDGVDAVLMVSVRVRASAVERTRQAEAARRGGDGCPWWWWLKGEGDKR